MHFHPELKLISFFLLIILNLFFLYLFNLCNLINSIDGSV